MIHAREIMEECQEDLKIPSTFEGSLLRWIHNAVQKIGVYPDSTGIQVCRIEICDERIDKPEDLIRPYRLFLLSNELNLSEARMVGHGMVRHKVDNWFPFSNGSRYEGKVDVRDAGSYWFIENSSAAKGYHAAFLEYFAVPYDPDTNEPLVPMLYREAVIAYIEWMWEKHLRRLNRQAVSLADIQSKEMSFLRESKAAVTRTSMPDMMQIDERAKAMWAPRFKTPRPLL